MLALSRRVVPIGGRICGVQTPLRAVIALRRLGSVVAVSPHVPTAPAPPLCCRGIRKQTIPHLPVMPLTRSFFSGGFPTRLPSEDELVALLKKCALWTAAAFLIVKVIGPVVVFVLCIGCVGLGVVLLAQLGGRGLWARLIRTHPTSAFYSKAHASSVLSTLRTIFRRAAEQGGYVHAVGDLASKMSILSRVSWDKFQRIRKFERDVLEPINIVTQMIQSREDIRRVLGENIMPVDVIKEEQSRKIEKFWGLETVVLLRETTMHVTGEKDIMAVATSNAKKDGAKWIITSLVVDVPSTGDHFETNNSDGFSKGNKRVVWDGSEED